MATHQSSVDVEGVMQFRLTDIFESASSHDMRAAHRNYQWSLRSLRRHRPLEYRFGFVTASLACDIETRHIQVMQWRFAHLGPKGC